MIQTQTGSLSHGDFFSHNDTTAISFLGSTDYASIANSKSFFSSTIKLKKPESASQSNIDTLSPTLIRRKQKEIIRFVLSDDYIEGEISKTQLFLEKLYAEDKYLFKASFQKAWLQLYSQEKDVFLQMFINISSGIDYELLQDCGDSLVLASYGHKNPLIKEAAIRAIEAWEQSAHLGYLRKMEPFSISWLESYRQEVIEYLEGI